MNIGQIAKNQQMIYRFVNRSTGGNDVSQLLSRFSSAKNAAAASKAEESASEFLQSMGLSGLQGRSIREMAQYKMRVQNSAAAAPAQVASNTAAAVASQRFSVRESFVPISDKAAEAMQKLALEDAKNSAGTTSAGATDRAKLIREHLQDVEPSKRSAAFNTMNKVWESETNRIAEYIKEKDGNWKNWGDRFDTSILNDYKPGVNVWV
ncbi:MAG: hypothetical protein IJU66_07755 [Oscillospiraceae bacterium]|nr:hypothetical protein [Oscillospiraceae bacterium]